MPIAALLFLAGATASGCPDTIHDNQLVGPVPGWEVHVDDHPRKLAGVKVFIGPPNLKQAVRPVPGADHSQHWNLAGKGEAWVECRYHDSSAVLSRSLGTPNGCTFRAPKGGANVVLGSFECDG